MANNNNKRTLTIRALSDGALMCACARAHLADLGAALATLLLTRSAQRVLSITARAHTRLLRNIGERLGERACKATSDK